VVLAWEDPSAGEMIEPRARVSAGDKDTLAGPTGRLVPKDGNSVSGILAGETAKAGKPYGANLLQPDKANPSNSVATVELGAERWKQIALHNLSLHAEVDEQSAANQTVDYWHTHDGSPIDTDYEKAAHDDPLAVLVHREGAKGTFLLAAADRVVCACSGIVFTVRAKPQFVDRRIVALSRSPCLRGQIAMSRCLALPCLAAKIDQITKVQKEWLAGLVGFLS